MIIRKSKKIRKTFSIIFFNTILLAIIPLASITIAEARSIPATSPVQVDIIDDTGKIFRQIKTSSQSYKVTRAYVQARKGRRYSLRLRNRSNRHVGVVIAVDGRNILTGAKSWLRSHEKMYILSPYETATYKGWRTAKNRINRFFFTATNNSYANAWQDRSAMGVIALAIFDEKPRIIYRNDHSANNKAKRAPAPAAEADSAGTGFGREEYSPTVKVRFKPKKKATAKHFYKYEWRKVLCKRGIINCDYPNKPDNRFWSEDSYAPYPHGMDRNDYRDNQHIFQNENSIEYNFIYDF